MTRSVRPYRVAGYCVVSSGITWDVDSQHIFRDTQEWVLWAQQFKSVALVELLTDKHKGDEAVLPWWSTSDVARPSWLAWRIRAAWLNVWRRRANRKAAKREQLYFSADQVAKRRALSQ